MSAPASCTCQKCVGACESKPGWFMPGEVDAVAAFLGITPEALFADGLMVDWWERWAGPDGTEDDRDVFVLSPAIVGYSGTEAPGNPRGRCVFLKDGLCGIHEVKPHECRMHIHDEPRKLINDRKLAIVAAWDDEDEQAEIRRLLGREPEIAMYAGGFFGLLLGTESWANAETGQMVITHHPIPGEVT